MSEDSEKAQKVGFSTNKATVDALNELTVEMVKKVGKKVPLSQVITLALGVGSKYVEEYLRTDEDLDVPIKKAQEEFKAKLEELRK